MSFVKYTKNIDDHAMNPRLKPKLIAMRKKFSWKHSNIQSPIKCQDSVGGYNDSLV